MGDASTTAAAAFGSSGEAAAAAVAAEDRHEGNDHGRGSVMSLNNSAEEDSKGGLNVEDGGDRSDNCVGNRWPRQETLALLKIRSDMDATFRDSSLKAPLWEEISRKLAELGYKRNAKKCKEKFENVYKYHKRTKDGRTGKSEGKTYRFFEELEAFDQSHHPPPPPPPPPPPKIPHQTITIPPISTNVSPKYSVTTDPTTHHNITPFPPPPPPPPPTSTTTTNNSFPLPQTIITKSIKKKKKNNDSNNGLLFSSPTSSSTASDEEFQARHKRKRKWRGFIRRLTREVVRKQEEMQKRFLETVAKCEHERTAREEAWRLQEMAKINHEHENLLQERSAAAAKDAAVIAFLQKVSSGVAHNLPISIDNIVRDNNNNSSNSISIPQPQPAPPPPPQPQPTTAIPTNTIRSLSTISSSSSSSRWPKAEVEALINLRTNLDLKYQDNVPKGPLWEEISAGMRRLGYNRSSKRCKEKWENINKYFKKVKDNNKKRSEDSKTCPYFHKLDAIYREKSKNIDTKAHENGGNSEIGTVQRPQPLFGMEPLMVQPERQWPLQEEEEEDDDDDDQDDEEEDDRETSSSTEVEEEHHDDRHKQGTGDHGSYGIVSNVPSSMDMVE